MTQSENLPIVMTLDAGGTNFVFSAVKQEKEIVEPYVLPAFGEDLDKSLRNIIKGFEHVRSQLLQPPAAISFAFPGPAEYAAGIIGDLGNLPGFRGGVALGPMLEDHFQLPVFINNDGDLFAYGEAIYGLLPQVNNNLKEAGSEKQFRNLLGLTLGTGFGGGLVCNGRLVRGDNDAAAEVWLLRNPLDGFTFAEENISARAITQAYTRMCCSSSDNLQPLDIYNIAMGNRPGDQQAALKSFSLFGKSLGMAITEVVTLVDGLVVFGGGLANAYPLFVEAMLAEMNGFYTSAKGGKVPRLVMKVYDLQNKKVFAGFARGESRSVPVPFSDRWVNYDPVKRTGVGVSVLGASRAISLGAYAFALDRIK